MEPAENPTPRMPIVVAHIQELRDQWFDADPTQLLTLQKATDDHEVFQEGYVGYRPKDGDYVSNLMGMLIYLDYDDVIPPRAYSCPIVIWLPRDSGFCVLNCWLFSWTNVEIVWNGMTYRKEFDVKAYWSDGFIASIYLPIQSPRRPVRGKCDSVLLAVTRVAITRPWFNDSSSNLILEGIIGSQLCTSLENCFSKKALRLCSRALAAKELPICIDGVSLSDEQWKVLHGVGYLIVKSKVPIPRSFWRRNQASSVTLDREAGEFDWKHTFGALHAMGQRSMPIDSVFFDMIWLKSPFHCFTSDFLAALGRVKCFSIESFRADFQSWERIWRSAALQRNDTLVELKFPDTLRIKDLPVGRGPAEVVELSLIHEGLQTNWFLEVIEIQYMSSGAREYWKTTIQPLLDMNRNHLPRLDPDEQRLSVLHDALIRLRNHPAKLFNLLVKYPHAWTPASGEHSASSLTAQQSLELRRQNRRKRARDDLPFFRYR